MRPDNIAIYALLTEALRLTKTASYRRFKPAVVKAAELLLVKLEPRTIPIEWRSLAAFYQKESTVADIREVIFDMRLQKYEAELVKLIEPRLTQIFCAFLQWDTEACVTATCGETQLSASIEPSIEEIDAVSDEISYHAGLVEHFGVENYLRQTSEAQVIVVDGLRYVYTNRFAMIEAEGETIRAPLRLGSAEHVRLWYGLYSAERGAANPADETVSNA